MPRGTVGPLIPKPGSSGGSSSGGGGSTNAPSKPKGLYVGVLSDRGRVGAARAYLRFKIGDLPGTVASARLEWQFIDKAAPTGNVALTEIEDFAAGPGGRLAKGDWGIAELATIDDDVLTPATDVDTKLNIDVTSRYLNAKINGRTHFCLKLQYDNEDEGVGIGRWYLVGATGPWTPKLVLTVTTGSDMRVTLLATPLTVDLAYADALGATAGVVHAGDDDYPPLGADVQLGATINGIQDDFSGTYTGEPHAPIHLGPDIIYFLLRSLDEGCGIAPALIDAATFLSSRTRLADWFTLAGGVNQRNDALTWISDIARACRSFRYLDRLGRETIYTQPTGGSGDPPVRLVQPNEHGAIEIFPISTESGALYPISRVDVWYGFDYLGVNEWEGHAVISPEETEPADADRQAQAVEAQARYGVRDLGGIDAEASPETSYAWVPLDTPGNLTGVKLRNWIWDQFMSRTIPVQGLTVNLPRFALTWSLMDTFDIESEHFPSAAARLGPTASPAVGVTEPAPLAYQARRARCTVREQPRILVESGSEFPVQITARIETWDTV